MRTEIQPHPLRWAHGWFANFFWDSQINQFTINQQLLSLEEHGFWQAIVDFWSREYDENRDMMGNSSMWVDEESQLLTFTSALSGEWFSFPPNGHHIDSWTIAQYYQYTDGQFDLIRIQEMLYDWDGTWKVRDLDKTTGVETIEYIEAEKIA